jgi:alkylhydroperoxidase/carboxymuconolactone decarboxylase family protein YurZ
MEHFYNQGRRKMSKKVVQTAGREQLGDFAPMFAHLNDDVLFGEVWNEEAIDLKTKCIITVVSLMASGITDSSLTYHLQNAKMHALHILSKYYDNIEQLNSLV